MKTLLAGMVIAAAVVAAGCSRSATAGPNGGDVVPIKGGTVKAEVVANPNTGEVMVQTYDNDLKARKPIEPQSITAGSGDNRVELMPHPVDTDPPGTSSRFYGQADWVRGGRMRDGWMDDGGTGANRQPFAWEHSSDGGRMHVGIWEAMGEHRRMGDHGPRRGPMER